MKPQLQHPQKQKSTSVAQKAASSKGSTATPQTQKEQKQHLTRPVLLGKHRRGHTANNQMENTEKMFKIQKRRKEM